MTCQRHPTFGLADIVASTAGLPAQGSRVPLLCEPKCMTDAHESDKCYTVKGAKQGDGRHKRARLVSSDAALVVAQMKATDARYTLQDSSEVMAFLERLVRWGGTPANGWHAVQQCLGWKLGAPVSAAAAGFLHSVAVGPVISPGDDRAQNAVTGRSDQDSPGAVPNDAVTLSARWEGSCSAA